MSYLGGKIILALTALMLVQHGVRHLLVADDRKVHSAADINPLLDAYHPFPSMSPKRNQHTVDPTPVQTVIAIKRGQAVAIGSLDQSIRLHEVKLSVSQGSTIVDSTKDRTWFDATVFSGERARKIGLAEPTFGFPQELTVGAAPPDRPPEPLSTRRFLLPFFRQGRVYERPLVRQLISHSEFVTIYGDPEDQAHAEAAEAIRSSNIPKALDLIARTIGPITDLDEDNRLALVLGQLADPVPPSSDEEPIRGCVRPADFLLGRATSTDVIYLDPDHLPVTDLQSLLAHEMAHAATFSLLVKSGQNPTSMPSWLNEAVAHFIEERLAPESANLKTRRHQFQSMSWNFPSMVPDDVTGIALRRGPVRIASLELLKSAFISHPELELKQVVISQGDGISRLETVTGDKFPLLFRQFTVRLMQQSQLPPAGDDITLRTAINLCDNAQQTIDLRGTAVAISSLATTDCQLTITATRDALLQITVLDLEESE